HLSTHHTQRLVRQFPDVGRVDWLGEARPATPRFELVCRCEQRLARHNVHVNTRFLVVEIFASVGRFGAVLLGHAVLFGRQPGNSVRVLLVGGHFIPPNYLSHEPNCLLVRQSKPSAEQSSHECFGFRGSSPRSTYSRPSGPIAVTCVTYSPDFAQWKWDVLPGSTITLPGGNACTLSPSNSPPRPM